MICFWITNPRFALKNTIQRKRERKDFAPPYIEFNFTAFPIPTLCKALLDSCETPLSIVHYFNSSSS